MPKFISNINTLADKYSGVFSVLQAIMPLICIACFWVFTLWLDSAYTRKDEYEADKNKTEQVLEEIKSKLNILIIGQSSFSVQMNSLQGSLTDHAERLRYLERKESTARR